MVHRWEDAEDFLIDAATTDLREADSVCPALVAFAGATLRFVAWLRPFDDGAYRDPLIELLALAAPLDSDRLMLSAGARMRPLDGTPPGDGEGEDGQRAIVLHRVDAAEDPVVCRSALYPCTGTVGELTVGARLDPGPATGWIPDALAAAVAERARLRASWADIAAQAARVERLGHVLWLPPDVEALMAQARAGLGG